MAILKNFWLFPKSAPLETSLFWQTKPANSQESRIFLSKVESVFVDKSQKIGHLIKINILVDRDSKSEYNMAYSSLNQSGITSEFRQFYNEMKHKLGSTQRWPHFTFFGGMIFRLKWQPMAMTD